MRWGPPLPIPNRVVKPTRANGTRIKPGRVGRRLTLLRNPDGKLSGFFFLWQAARNVKCKTLNSQNVKVGAVLGEHFYILHLIFFILHFGRDFINEPPLGCVVGVEVDRR